MVPFGLSLLGVALLVGSTTAFAQVFHDARRNERQNGRHVEPRLQDDSDQTRINGWGGQGDTNPFTGTRAPYARQG